MRILVTGADGFVAGYLIPKLHEDKHELFLIGGCKQVLKKKYGSFSICLSYLDFKQEKLNQIVTKFSPEVVIHLAAYSTPSDSYSDMKRLFTANILFVGKILDALKRTKLKCFIYTGSCTEYYKGDGIFNPTYLYSATKTAGRSILDYYSETYNYKTIFVVPYTVYGGINAQKKIIDILYDSLNSDFPVNTTFGEQVLDFIHVLDLVELYLKILDHIDLIPDKTNFHAGTGKGNTIRELVAILEKNSNKKANINWGGIPYRKKDTMFAIADIKKQQELFNWQPRIELNKGVRMYLDIKDKGTS